MSNVNTTDRDVAATAIVKNDAATAAQNLGDGSKLDLKRKSRPSIVAARHARAARRAAH